MGHRYQKVGVSHARQNACIQSVGLVHGMLSTHFCILLQKSNWSLLLSCGPVGLSVPARGGLLFLKTVHAQAYWMLLTLCVGINLEDGPQGVPSVDP